mmetsp:Transcript_24322/g.77061  ORF Transcript_24322/g.77061 Transcript_24322/m.77061 type:complete len:332 (+) Transcript_24322:206-1201(+)
MRRETRSQADSRALSRRRARRRGEGGSQEVVWHARSEVGHLAQVLRPRLEDLKVNGSLDRDGEDGGDVAAAVAVVWRRPDGHQRVVEHVLVPFHHQLVRARDQVDRVGRAELGDHVAAEQVARASRRQPPPVDVLRVGPHQVAHRPLVGWLLDAVEVLDLVDGVEGGGEAPVHAQHRVVHHCGKAEAVEHVDARSPDGRVTVLLEALVVEAVHLRDLSALVVASDQRDALWVPDLERKQQQERLDRVVAAVDKVAHEDIVHGGHLTADVEQLEQVVKLPVDVAHHHGGGRHVVHIGLLHQDFLCLFAQRLDGVLRDDFALLQTADVLIHIS